MQNQWASVLTPIIKNPIVSGGQLDDIILDTGDNVINHKLGRQPQGWVIVDIDAAAVIYRSAEMTPKTLTLNSDADCTVSIYVY